MVSESEHAVSGGKALYVYVTHDLTDGQLSREPQEDEVQSYVLIGGGNSAPTGSTSRKFNLAPLEAPLIITPDSTIHVSLWLLPPITGGSRQVYVQLWRNGDTQIGGDSAMKESNVTVGTPILQEFSITAPAGGVELPEGEWLQLRVINASAPSGYTTVLQLNEDQRSTVTVPTNTIIHVEELTVHAAEDPSAPPKDFYDPGEEIRIRAIVSDPFGYADITGGSLTIRNPSGTIVQTIPVSNNLHTIEDEISGAIRTYEVEYTISEEAPYGTWAASFTAFEGTEGEISHTANAVFVVGNPEPVLPLAVEKTAKVISDPVNGTDNPKAIPGAIVEYEITVTNPNAGRVDPDSVFIYDPIPVQVALRVSDIEEPGSGPVAFTDGSPSSGLTYEFPSNLAFSSDNGASWDHEPSADSDGTDPAVTDIRINPQGAFEADNAQFTARFRVTIR